MGLDFDRLTKKFRVDVDTIKSVADSMRHALLHIRNAAGLPLGPYVLEGTLTDAEHAQMRIIDAAEKLGIDLGAPFGNELDLRDLAQ